MTEKEITAMKAVYYLAERNTRLRLGGTWFEDVHNMDTCQRISFYEAMQIVGNMLYDSENEKESETMDKLKPCPFCGGEARLLLNAKRKIYGKDEYKTGVVACCNVCEARMFYASEELAIKAWNRRVNNA